VEHLNKLLCGIDLGGTKINTGIANNKGEVLANVIIDTKAEEGQDAVIDRMIKSVYTVLDMANVTKEDLTGIGIGVPGLIDSWEGLVIEAANLPGWRDVPIVDIFTEEFNINIRLENDANAAAIGEYLFGSGRGNEDFIYLTVSTGIGGGAILDGKLYSGSNSNASEIGHSIIDFNGPKCNCGSYGCFETFASGTAIARIAKERVDNNENTIISKLAIDGKIKAEHVFEAARSGDVIAMEIIDREAFYLGIGIVNILAFYNPEKIAIGGGVSSQWDILSERVAKVVEERALKPNAKICKIVKAQLGKDVGLLGACGLVLSNSK
jgi:glucokinase